MYLWSRFILFYFKTNWVSRLVEIGHKNIGTCQRFQGVSAVDVRNGFLMRFWFTLRVAELFRASLRFHFLCS